MQLPFLDRQQNEYLLSKRDNEIDPDNEPGFEDLEDALRTGILVLDKPAGPTSHQATDYVKHVTGATKAGHGGTLDPGVTGVLPIALQSSTRVTYALLDAGKEYVCLMYLHGDVPRDALSAAFDEYTGVIEQLPPVKSAVKREVRKRNVYYIEELDRDGRHVLFRVGCQGGTYIRKLCHDLGEYLGVGAHMKELRRTRAGPFTEGDAVNIQELQDYIDFYNDGTTERILDMILPREAAARHMKKVFVHESTVESLSHGAYLKVPGVIAVHNTVEKGDRVAVLTERNELLLIGEAEMSAHELVSQEKGVAVETKQVYKKP